MLYLKKQFSIQTINLDFGWIVEELKRFFIDVGMMEMPVITPNNYSKVFLCGQPTNQIPMDIDKRHPIWHMDRDPQLSPLSSFRIVCSG